MYVVPGGTLPLVSCRKRVSQKKIDMGAAYGTAKSGVGIMSMGIFFSNAV